MKRQSITGIAIAGLIALGTSQLALAQPVGDPVIPASAAPKGCVLPDDRVATPMLDLGGRPGVYVTINGKGPFRFIVDTGSSVALVMDPVIQDLVQLPEVKSDDMPAGGQGLYEQRLEVDTLAIGSAEFMDFRAITMPLKRMFGDTPDAPDGVVGLPIFEDLLLTYDMVDQELIMERGALRAGDIDVLPILEDEATGVGVSVALTAGGVACKAHIDTGSPGELLLPGAMVGRIPVDGELVVIGKARSPMGESEIRAGRLDGSVVIGDHVFEDMQITFGDIGAMQSGGFGNIGSKLLDDFALTVDQRNGLVRLSRKRAEGTGPQRAAAAPGSGKLGMAVRVGADSVVIEHVEPRSHAHLSGLMAGDEIVAVGGTPVAGLSARELQPLMAGDEVKLTILRDGEQRQITLKR